MEIILAAIGIAVTVIIAGVTGIWALNKSIMTQFRSLGEAQVTGYHNLDVRMARIETTVTPYGDDIANLKTQQQQNLLDIAELKALGTEVTRMGRELETLRNRK